MEGITLKSMAVQTFDRTFLAVAVNKNSEDLLPALLCFPLSPPQPSPLTTLHNRDDIKTIDQIHEARMVQCELFSACSVSYPQTRISLNFLVAH